MKSRIKTRTIEVDHREFAYTGSRDGWEMYAFKANANNDTNTHLCERYKLHISILPDNLDSDSHDQVIQNIFKVIEKYCQNGLIYKFKLGCKNAFDAAIYDVKRRMKSEMDAEKIKLLEKELSALLREHHNPVIIYLPEKLNHLILADFCHEIELTLKKLKVDSSECKSIADLVVTDHVRFRRETINRKYVEIASASASQMNELVTAGLSSDIYVNLKRILNDRLRVHLFALRNQVDTALFCRHKYLIEQHREMIREQNNNNHNSKMNHLD